MKILNPTVFLDNGELKCLTVEVPKEPKKWEKGDSLSYNEAAWQLYNERNLEAKSSAVKVKNADACYDAMWRTDQRITSPFSLYNWKEILLPRQDLYTLTGYEAEVKTYSCNHNKTADEIECPKSMVEFPDCCGTKERVATISPAVKEESQEDEFELQFGNSMKCKLKIVNGNLEVVAGVDGWGAPLTKDDFTITRKK